MFNLKQQLSCGSLVMLIRLESAQFLCKINGELGYNLSVCPLFYKFMFSLSYQCVSMCIWILRMWNHQFVSFGRADVCVKCMLLLLAFVVFVIYSQRHWMVLEYKYFWRNQDDVRKQKPKKGFSWAIDETCIKLG